MSISGRIEDVPVVDVLSILHLAGRSGELTITSPLGQARITFRSGAITAASCPALKRSLGHVLVESGHATQEQVDRALEVQRERNRPLGTILQDLGFLTKDRLRAAVAALIREVVTAAYGWKSGEFCFEMRTVFDADGVAVVPDEVALDVGLQVKELLFDALQVIEAQGQLRTQARAIESEEQSGENGAPVQEGRSESGSPSTTIAVPGSLSNSSRPCDPLSKSPAVVLVSHDGIVANVLRAAFAELGLAVRVFGFEQEAARHVAELSSKHTDVAVVLHATTARNESDSRASLAVARRFKAEFSRIPLIVTGALSNAERLALLRLGVRGVVDLPNRGRAPQDVADFRAALARACEELGALLQGTFLDLAGNSSMVDGSTHDLRRLSELVDGLHRSTGNAAVALALLEYVAESVERSVFFLCRKTDVIAVSAFGCTPDGRPLSEIALGLGIAFDECEALRTMLSQARAVREQTSSASSDASPLFRRIGKPRSGSALWIPVRSIDRVFAVLYADNGTRMRPLVSTEALQILACQAGLMLQNMALQRRLNRPSDARQAAG